MTKPEQWREGGVVKDPLLTPLTPFTGQTPMISNIDLTGGHVSRSIDEIALEELSREPTYRSILAMLEERKRLHREVLDAIERLELARQHLMQAQINLHFFEAARRQHD